MAKAARDAGADQFGANVLFLMPCAHRVFFPFLSDHFPEHVARYEESFAGGAYLKGEYPERIRQLVESIRRRVGIPSRDLETLQHFLQRPAAQLSLFC
ncbi:MAG: hypothetical protein JOZ62_03220 [Acidobacteriaceae bacterium]|nr:hypothetical protein [Acidobacteriaceae bacterium]